MRRSTFWLLAFVLLAACGETPGARVTFSAGVPIADRGPFEVGGWQVTFTEARLAFGPVWIYADPAATAARLPPLLRPARALAHPGHDDQGDVMGEILRQRVALLHAGDTALGDGAGIAGAWDLMEVMLQPSDALDGYTARLAATATRGEDSFVFTADVVMDLHVDRIPFGARVDGEGHLEVSVDLYRWVERIDFDALWEEAAPLDGPIGLAPGTQAHNAVYIGIRSRSAFSPTWHPAVPALD